MINMEFAKFMFKYNSQFLPDSFDNYFIKLKTVHKYNTWKKTRNEFYQPYVSFASRKKKLFAKFT